MQVGPVQKAGSHLRRPSTSLDSVVAVAGHNCLLICTRGLRVRALRKRHGMRSRSSLPREHAHSIERCGGMFIGPAPGHASHHRQGILCRCAAMLATLKLPHPEFGVLTTLPNRQQRCRQSTYGAIAGARMVTLGASQAACRLSAKLANVPGSTVMLEGRSAGLRSLGSVVPWHKPATAGADNVCP